MALPGLMVCRACKCRRSGCTSKSRRPLPYCAPHMFDAMCLELRVTATHARALVSLDPVDLTEFLAQAPKVNDLLLRTLLADTWEPVAVRELAARFEKLNHNYSSEELGECFRSVIDALNDENLTGDFTQSVMRTAPPLAAHLCACSGWFCRRRNR